MRSIFEIGLHGSELPLLIALGAVLKFVFSNFRTIKSEFLEEFHELFKSASSIDGEDNGQDICFKQPYIITSMPDLRFYPAKTPRKPDFKDNHPVMD